MAAVYPSALKSFVTRTDFVDTIFAAHMNEAQEEIAAIQSTLGLNPQGGFATVTARIADLEAGTTDPNHTHETADVDTGVFPVSRGGTGLGTLTVGNFLRGNGTGAVTLTTPAQVRTDIGAAATSHTHAAADVTSGTFSVSRGGTGLSTLTSGSFMQGNGTGAVAMRTPAQVLTDIGAAAAGHVHDVDATRDVMLLGGM